MTVKADMFHWEKMNMKNVPKRNGASYKDKRKKLNPGPDLI